jgi:2-methylisocitrate lyase-like PEP mutase family enzyme
MTRNSSFTKLAAKADRFRALHAGPKLLVLTNVWDALSARLVEAAGYAAIATSSAGVAHSLGYADGQYVPRQEMLAAVARIARVVELPVSADLEGGYGVGPENAARLAGELIAAGAIGLNLEDGLDEATAKFKDLSQEVEEIHAIREVGAGAGVPIVINARTDTFWQGKEEKAKRFAEAVRRCRAYREAGADCVFVPGLSDAETIGAFVREIGAPLNVLAGTGVPNREELSRLGVRRLSFGSSLGRATYGHFRKLLSLVVDGADLESTLTGAVPYSELNALFASRDVEEGTGTV